MSLIKFFPSYGPTKKIIITYQKYLNNSNKSIIFALSLTSLKSIANLSSKDNS